MNDPHSHLNTEEIPLIELRKPVRSHTTITEALLRHCQTSIMEQFFLIIAINSFRKRLYHRCSTGP